VLLDKDATKSRISQVLTRLSGGDASASMPPSTPDDLVIVVYSGHGYGNRATGSYHLFPHDIGTEGRQFAPTATQISRSVSTDDLSTLFRPLDAAQIVMIIDACNSSASVLGAAGSQFKPGPMDSRGFGQLAYDKAMRVLAASQLQDVAREFPSLRHGLLTYVLAQEGLVNRAADINPADGEVHIGEWLQYALERTPVLNQKMARGEYPEKGFGVRPVTRQFKSESQTMQVPGLFDFRVGRSDALLASRADTGRPGRTRPPVSTP
jgi:Caspase domain